MKKLAQLIHYVVKPQNIVISSSDTARLNQDYKHMCAILHSKHRVYGFNTLVGHKDKVQSTQDTYLDEFLKSHLLGFGEGYSQTQCRYIAASRIMAWLAGGTGISPNSFARFIAYYQANYFDKHADADQLEQIYIPKFCSYSSGDVIPATHLLASFLQTTDYQKNFAQTDIMPFINGNFVQMGVAAALVSPLNDFWQLFLHNSALQCALHEANQSNFVIARTASLSNLSSNNKNQIITELAESFMSLCPNNKPTQDVISIRSMYQQFDTFLSAVYRFCVAIDKGISHPSGNPLFFDGYDASVSQASFMAFDLTDAVLSALNALKLLVSTVVNRTGYLLSGHIDGIPQDCSLYDEDLGLIQYPKVMMALEEQISLSLPPASVYNAKLTSDGVEDVWNNGLNCLNILQQVTQNATELLMVEAYIHQYIYHKLPNTQAKFMLIHDKLGIDHKRFLNSLGKNEVGSDHYQLPTLRDFIQHNNPAIFTLLNDSKFITAHNLHGLYQ